MTNDQSKEIERMHEVLLGLSDDPRARLAPGFDDAEEAIGISAKSLCCQNRPAFTIRPTPPNFPRALPAKRLGSG